MKRNFTREKEENSKRRRRRAAAGPDFRVRHRRVIKIGKENTRAWHFSRPSDGPTYSERFEAERQTRYWSEIKIFPRRNQDRNLSLATIRSKGGPFSRWREKDAIKLAGGPSRFIGGLLLLFRGGRSGEILSSNGVHVTLVRPDLSVRRYVVRVYVNRRSFGLARFHIFLVVGGKQNTPLRTPAMRPVFAATRSENSGLFKGNDGFYFRSSRQFEFLITHTRHVAVSGQFYYWLFASGNVAKILRVQII